MRSPSLRQSGLKLSFLALRPPRSNSTFPTRTRGLRDKPKDTRCYEHTHTQRPVTPMKSLQLHNNCLEASGKHTLLFWPGCHQPSSEGIDVNSKVYPRGLTIWSSKWTPVWRPYNFIQGLAMCLKSAGKHHKNEWSVKTVALHTQTHILS